MKNSALIFVSEEIFAPAESFLKQKGWNVKLEKDCEQFLQKPGQQNFALVFLPVRSEAEIGLIRELRQKLGISSNVLVCGPDHVGLAVQAMQSGAAHYWAAPPDTAQLQTLFANGIASRASHRLQREETLLQVIKEIALTMELDGLANILVDSAIELTGADGGAILLPGEKSNSLSIKAIRGFSEQTVEHFGLPESKFSEILKARRPLLLDLPNKIRETTTISGLIVAPICWKEVPLAELVIMKTQQTEPFSADDFKLISLFCEEIAGAVHNAIVHYKTKELTIKDDLTDAYNRRYFDQYLDEEFVRANRYGSNLSLIFFDVDNLKDVNVKYGHLTGSKTLQEIAHRIILTVRGIDKVVRYGGDEFCIVLPETDTQGAYQVAERVRNTIANRPFRINENAQVNLTGSIGIASFPTHASTKDDLIRQADRAMFTVKNQSKNAIGVAQGT